MALRRGDTVGIVAPSGIVNRESLDRGIAALESAGFQVKVWKSVFSKYGYLAGEDRDRAKDFTEAWTDPDIDAVVAARGGFGATRMLRYLDFGILKLHKKALVGYSDITALHLAFWKKMRLVTFHGPVVESGEGSGLLEPWNLDGFLGALSGDRMPGDLQLPGGMSLTTGSGGRAQGELVGGNLSLIAASIGTQYEIDTRGKVLFLEEVGEAPYRVDRMLCQLDASGKLDAAAGFLVGDLTNCEAREGSPSFTVQEVVRQYLCEKGKPCLYGIPAGHAHYKTTLPLGIRVNVDADEGRVTFLERPVLVRK